MDYDEGLPAAHKTFDREKRKMNEKQYHNRLFDLTAKLARAASARPYDPDAYNSIIDDLNKLSTMPIRLRRQFSLFTTALFIFVCIIVAWIIYELRFYI